MKQQAFEDRYRPEWDALERWLHSPSKRKNAEARNTYSFVSGHSALELTGIALAGAAGLKLGVALIAPGTLARKQALVAAGREAAGIMYGVAAMLFAAAFVEAFWSPRTFAPGVKHAVGAAMWLAVLAYFAYAGRARGA
jgi:hypothetical protein